MMSISSADADEYSAQELAALLNGITSQIQGALDSAPKARTFDFEPIWHCFEQYESILESLRERSAKFDMVPRIIATIDDDPEFQYDLLNRRFLKTLIVHCQTCLALLENVIEQERKLKKSAISASDTLFQPQSFDQSELNRVVSELLSGFKHIIELKKGWKFLWKDDGQPVDERQAQRLFLTVTKLMCDERDIDVSPEADQGSGCVDFKFSKSARIKHLLEFKMSSHQDIAGGYEIQLPRYMAAEKTDHGTLVVIEIGPWKGREALEALAAKHANRKLFIVDGKPQATASKLKK